MATGPGERYDFFLSRRGSVAPIAREVTDVLTEKGYRVFVQDYDIPLTANFIEEMHEAIKNARDLVVLFTRDYEQSPYTRMEFTSFEANAAQSAEATHGHPALRGCPLARSIRAPRLSGPRRHRGRGGTKEPYPRRAGRALAGAQAAASTVHWSAAAHRELHGPLRRTRQARRHPDARQARCCDAGVGRARGGAGHGRRGQDLARRRVRPPV